MCWQNQHNKLDASTGVHKPLTRNSKNTSGSAATFRQLPEIKAVEVKPDQPYSVGGSRVPRSPVSCKCECE